VCYALEEANHRWFFMFLKKLILCFLCFLEQKGKSDEELKKYNGQWKRVRMFVVGDGGAGKTSVIRWLKGEAFREKHEPTDSAEIETIDLKDWKPAHYNPYAASFLAISTFYQLLPNINESPSENQANESRDGPGDNVAEQKDITLHVWDCGGQSIYYNTHHFFFTANAIYLVVIDLSRNNFETEGMEGLEFWIRSIRCYASDATIRIVATHTDEVTEVVKRSRLHIMQQSLASVRVFNRSKREDVFEVSCKNSGEDLRDRLRSQLMELATQQQIQCPHRWAVFFGKHYEKLKSVGSQLSTVYLSQLKELAVADKLEDIMEALQFCHKQGILLHFNDQKLDHIVFLEPKRLVEAFRTIITANVLPQEYYDLHSSAEEIPYNPLSDDEVIRLRETGRLKKDTIERVWQEQKYTKETQEYVRELMVKFGLAVEDPTNKGDLIIPCLVTRLFKVPGNEKTKRWEYRMTSMTPPLGMS